MNILNNLSFGSLLVGGQLINKDREAVATQATNPVVQTDGSRYSAGIKITSANTGSSYGLPKLSSEITFSNPDNTSQVSQLLAKNHAIPPIKPQLGQQYGAPIPALNPGQRLNGGMIRLPELATLGESYEQDIRQYAQLNFPDDNGRYKALDLTGFTDKKSEDLASINLQIKTRDGDVINFSLTSYKGYGSGDDERPASFTGTRVAFEVEGDLSPDELKQVEAFAQKINQASEGYFSNGKVDIGDLELSTFSQFSDVDLSFLNDADGSGVRNFKLSYQDDAQSRSIDVNLNGDQAQITIDKTSLGIGANAQQQKQALQEYLTLLEDSADEVHAEQTTQNLMMETFELGFTQLTTEAEDAARHNSQKNTPIETQALNKKVENALVGLPDFKFSFDSLVKRPNSDVQPNEYEGFKLNLSLKTHSYKYVENRTETISQKQKFHLTGAYYTPLEGADEPDFSKQNYRYTELDRVSEKITQLVTKDNQLILAMSTEQGEFNKTTQEYREGKLVDEDSEFSGYSQIVEFTELAQQENTLQSRELLNTVMIDPYQKNKEDTPQAVETVDGRLIRGQNDH